MPALFVGHGNPMNAIEPNRFGDAWEELGRRIGQPEAIVCVSAHWFIAATAVTAMARPRTIHDFYGFPQELFDVEYPAPGSPTLAGEIIETVKPTWCGRDEDSWGLDHGTWSVLNRMYPSAEVPVVQISVDASKSIDYHVGLGAQLAPLREQGVLIIASGNIVHNLRLIQWQMDEAGFDWAHDFDDSAREVLTHDPSSFARLEQHSAYRAASPTPDHFWPAAYLAGLASAAGETCDVVVEGYVAGSLSMTSYALGLPSGD